MKKILTIMLATMIVLPAFQSCKKGENDPGISFRSRKARLIGTWKLKEGLENIALSNGGYEKNIYDGLVKIHEQSGLPTETKEYKREISIEKSGTYKMTTYDDLNMYIDEGIWYFGTKNKDLDVRNKETVCFVTQRHSYASNGGTLHTIEMSGTHALGYPLVWQIDRLANDELVILLDYT